MVMPKACIGAVIAGVLTTEASAGLPGVFAGSAPTVVVTATPHKNPDGSNVKDTRT